MGNTITEASFSKNLFSKHIPIRKYNAHSNHLSEFFIVTYHEEVCQFSAAAQKKESKTLWLQTTHNYLTVFKTQKSERVLARSSAIKESSGARVSSEDLDSFPRSLTVDRIYFPIVPLRFQQPSASPLYRKMQFSFSRPATECLLSLLIQFYII